MKIKRKIITIMCVLLLVTIPISTVQAEETSTNETENETTTVKLATIIDGIQNIEEIAMSEPEITELQTTITNLIGQLENAKGIFDIDGIIDNILGGRAPIIYNIIKSILNLRFSHGRAFVISHGRSYNINPFKQNEFKINRLFTFWHYSPMGLIQGKTLILRPLSLTSSKILRGRQIGFMTRFTGVYLNIPKMFPEKTYTFFMGMARHVNGMDFSFLKL
jgi:hypothetical protein